MPVEIRMLGWSICLGLIYVFAASILVTRERGLKWNAGNRDGEPAALSGVAARAQRASGNFLETFPFFAAAVLGVCFAKLNSPHTALGAELYFGARVLYLPIYIAGIPYVRTLVWAVSFWGLLQLLEVWF